MLKETRLIKLMSVGNSLNHRIRLEGVELRNLKLSTQEKRLKVFRDKKLKNDFIKPLIKADRNRLLNWEEVRREEETMIFQASPETIRRIDGPPQRPPNSLFTAVRESFQLFGRPLRSPRRQQARGTTLRMPWAGIRQDARLPAQTGMALA